MVRHHYRQGDRVVFRVTKFSSHPGPRAENIAPAPHGESYHYTVDKFWIVAGFASTGELILRTRRGKQHLVNAGDIRLRRANIWERWRYRSRFEEIERLRHDDASEQVEQKSSSAVMSGT